MKTKMKLAHEYMQNTLNLLRKHDIPYDFESLIEESYEYAEAMIAEEDKRTNQTQEEWQPDWSEAPEWAKWWAMDRDGESYYFKCKPEMKLVTWIPTGTTNHVFLTQSNYQGDWKDSLRERPE